MDLKRSTSAFDDPDEEDIDLDDSYYSRGHLKWFILFLVMLSSVGSQFTLQFDAIYKYNIYFGVDNDLYPFRTKPVPTAPATCVDTPNWTNGQSSWDMQTCD